MVNHRFRLNLSVKKFNAFALTLLHTDLHKLAKDPTFGAIQLVKHETTQKIQNGALDLDLRLSSHKRPVSRFVETLRRISHLSQNPRDYADSGADVGVCFLAASHTVI